ncbi:hypothetical protein C1646_776797 [Rhizophagus diaphanus]|nr:hypothetical protein C1646_776797 [Rhizophagus diaphanus] [Rhizophagus sp. MUCL 43196]
MVKTGNGDPNHAELCKSATKEWNNIKRKDKSEIDDIIRVDPVQEISVNASAQKKAANKIQIAEKKLTVFE